MYTSFYIAMMVKEKRSYYGNGVQRVLNSYLNASSPVSQFDASNLGR